MIGNRIGLLIAPQISGFPFDIALRNPFSQNKINDGMYLMVHRVCFSINKTQYVNFFFEDCPVNWHAFGYSCYSVRTILSGVSWIEAEEACQTFGDHLVSIGDQSEMAFVHYLLTVLFPHYGRNQVFIGLSQLHTCCLHHIYMFILFGFFLHRYMYPNGFMSISTILYKNYDLSDTKYNV